MMNQRDLQNLINKIKEREGYDELDGLNDRLRRYYQKQYENDPLLIKDIKKRKIYSTNNTTLQSDLNVGDTKIKNVDFNWDKDKEREKETQEFFDFHTKKFQEFLNKKFD